MWRPWGKETKDANTQVPKSYKKVVKQILQLKINYLYVYLSIDRSINLYLCISISIRMHTYIKYL